MEKLQLINYIDILLAKNDNKHGTKKDMRKLSTLILIKAKIRQNISKYQIE